MRSTWQVLRRRRAIVKAARFCRRIIPPGRLLLTGARRGSLTQDVSLVARVVVSLEQVKTEIVFVIAPHRVNVISLILRAVHLDQKGRSLDAIVVQAAALNISGPSEES